MELKELGWSEFFEEHFAALRGDGMVPARVTREHRGAYVVHTGAGELPARVSGKFRHEAGSKGDFPAVGDWVAMRRKGDEDAGTIHAILPRRSAFSRKAPGAVTQEQVVAANIDTALLVSDLAGERGFSLRRIERYLAVAWTSGADPVIVLNKCDLCETSDSHVAEVESIAAGVPVHATSATEGKGIDACAVTFRRARPSPSSARRVSANPRS